MDDGAIWKRGHYVEYLIREMQGAPDKAQGADKCGFRLALAKSKYIVYDRTKNLSSQGLWLNGERLKNVKVLSFELYGWMKD